MKNKKKKVCCFCGKGEDKKDPWGEGEKIHTVTEKGVKKHFHEGCLWDQPIGGWGIRGPRT